MKILKSLVIVVAMAAMVAVGTSSYFNDKARIPDNTFALGEVNIGETTGFPLMFTGMAPGGMYTQDVGVAYVGSLPADLYFGVKDQSGDNLSEILEAGIFDIDTDSWVIGWQPILTYFGSWTKVAGSVPQNGTKNYRVYVRVAADADNSYKGMDNKSQVILYATQVGAPAPLTPPWEY